MITFQNTFILSKHVASLNTQNLSSYLTKNQMSPLHRPISWFCLNHTEHIHTLSGKNSEFLDVKAALPVVSLVGTHCAFCELRAQVPDFTCQDLDYTQLQMCSVDFESVCSPHLRPPMPCGLTPDKASRFTLHQLTARTVIHQCYSNKTLPDL